MNETLLVCLMVLVATMPPSSPWHNNIHPNNNKNIHGIEQPHHGGSHENDSDNDNYNYELVDAIEKLIDKMKEMKDEMKEIKEEMREEIKEIREKMWKELNYQIIEKEKMRKELKDEIKEIKENFKRI